MQYQMSDLFMPSNAKTRSICAENPKGDKGSGATALPDDKSPARELGKGWKVRPCLKNIQPGECVVLGEITGPAIITHIWMTFHESFRRDLVLRIYWDGEDQPSVVVPAGDFFCSAYRENTTIVSLPVNVNPRGGFNCFWPMPFRKSAKLVLENQSRAVLGDFFYQIDYLLTEVPEQAHYFHAQWRRQNPLPYLTEYTILDKVKGSGRFAGMYLAWGQNSNGWWGEGEVKFYMDGDREYPTYCGTGTEDYFGGAWCFANQDYTAYETYCAPYMGYPQLIRPDGYQSANQRHGLYRWHIADPIFFQKEFKATIQALGWRNAVQGEENRFLPLQDDIASTAFWYQSEPHITFPKLPAADFREII